MGMEKTTLWSSVAQPLLATSVKFSRPGEPVRSARKPASHHVSDWSNGMDMMRSAAVPACSCDPTIEV